MRPQQSIETLKCRFIQEQPVFLPGGSHQFDRFDVAAHGAFTECLLHDRFPVHNMPSVLYTKLIRCSDKKSEDFIKECHTCLCKTTLEILQRAELEDLPVMEELLQATLLKPSKCFEELQRGKNQSVESNIKQNEVFKHIKNHGKLCIRWNFSSEKCDNSRRTRCRENISFVHMYIIFFESRIGSRINSEHVQTSATTWRYTYQQNVLHTIL